MALFCTTYIKITILYYKMTKKEETHIISDMRVSVATLNIMLFRRFVKTKIYFFSFFLFFILYGLDPSSNLLNSARLKFTIFFLTFMFGNVILAIVRAKLLGGLNYPSSMTWHPKLTPYLCNATVGIINSGGLDNLTPRIGYY